MRAVDDRGRSPITVAELAAFLGLTTSAVRQIVRRGCIPSVGKEGKAKLYWCHEVVKVVGAHDRTIARKRRQGVSH